MLYFVAIFLLHIDTILEHEPQKIDAFSHILCIDTYCTNFTSKNIDVYSSLFLESIAGTAWCFSADSHLFSFFAWKINILTAKMSLYNFKKIMVVPPAKVIIRKYLIYCLRPGEHPLPCGHNLVALFTIAQYVNNNCYLSFSRTSSTLCCRRHSVRRPQWFTRVTKSRVFVRSTHAR